MSMTGELYRVSARRFEELLRDPDAVQAELYPDDFPANVERRGCSVEKAWHAIEFMLTRLTEAGRVPTVWPLVGGPEIGPSLSYGPAWYRTPEEVRQIADVLSRVSREDFRWAYAPELMAADDVYPNIWDRADEREANFDYVWQWFAGMVDFYREAAAAGDAVLLHFA